jgi:hypothetical protein
MAIGVRDAHALVCLVESRAMCNSSRSASTFRSASNVIAALAIVLGTLVPAIAAAAEPTPDPAEPYVVARLGAIASSEAQAPAIAQRR